MCAEDVRTQADPIYFVSNMRHMSSWASKSNHCFNVTVGRTAGRNDQRGPPPLLLLPPLRRSLWFNYEFMQGLR